MEIKVEEMKQLGAELIGEIEEENGEWVAVCDTGGVQNTGYRWYDVFHRDSHTSPARASSCTESLSFDDPVLAVPESRKHTSPSRLRSSASA